MQITNIAGYKFIALQELELLRAELMQQCADFDIKGTILLSTEGINLSLAGLSPAITAFKAYLLNDERFADMTFRESLSAAQPFSFMKVKIKKEIITMKQSAVRPEVSQRAPSISPNELKQWLDEKRDIVMVDTRNDYEVRFGTFDQAIHFQLNDFAEFPAAAKALPHDRPIVMFCTGGIRCEKAALQLMNDGISEVYQLDGGILNYFKEVGAEHYQGECFIFDHRISLDANLEETGTTQCKACQGPVRVEQQCCTVCEKRKSNSEKESTLWV